MRILRTGLAAGLLASLCSAASALDYREARHGDLPWEGPLAELVFDYGTNTVTGRMQVIAEPDGTSAADMDPFKLVLPDGAALLRADVTFFYGDTTRNTGTFILEWDITVDSTTSLCFSLEAPSEICPNSSRRRGGGTIFSGAAIAPFGLIVAPSVLAAAEDWSQTFGGRVSYTLTFEVGSPPALAAGALPITPVPEPATWALMALGIAATLGTRARRRRTDTRPAD
jgi:hypothetical protein